MFSAYFKRVDCLLIWASFKMFNFEVFAYLFEIKSKISDFEPVDKSRSSGTQISDKRGRFEIGSSMIWIKARYFKEILLV